MPADPPDQPESPLPPQAEDAPKAEDPKPPKPIFHIGGGGIHLGKPGGLHIGDGLHMG